MKRIRMNRAKLFIGKPDGTWEEIKGVTIGPCAIQVELQDAPAEIPGRRDFVASWRMYDLTALDLPPIGSDPTRN